MELILLQDVEFLGYSDDLVNVKNGYGRNYLIPQRKAVLATGENRVAWEKRVAVAKAKEEALLAKLKEVSEKLKAGNLKIGAKVGTSGKIFGSVTSLQIADSIKREFDVEIDRRKINLEGDIKTLGNYIANVSLGTDNVIEVAFEVVAE